MQGVAALVGTRLGVGSFVSWTLLLARINLLPPPLTPPPPPLLPPLPTPPPPPPSSPVAATLPSKRKGGLEVALPVLVPTVANGCAHAAPANHPSSSTPSSCTLSDALSARRQRRDGGGGGGKRVGRRGRVRRRKINWKASEAPVSVWPEARMNGGEIGRKLAPVSVQRRDVLET